MWTLAASTLPAPFFSSTTTDNGIDRLVHEHHHHQTDWSSHEHSSSLIFVRFMFSCVCLMIGIPGIFGNAVIIVINSMQQLTSISAYMSALSISNICFLILWLGTNSVRYVVAVRVIDRFEAEYDSSQWYAGLCIRLQWISLPLINITQTCFILLTMMISIDRCICLRFCLRSHRYCSVRISLIAIATIVLFSIAYCTPFFFEYTYRIVVSERASNSSNGGRQPLSHKIASSSLLQYDLALTRFGIRHQKLLHSYLYIPILYLIPFTIIIVTNIMIIKQMIEVNRRKAAASPSILLHTDTRLTKVIVLIMVAFFLCQFPVLILNILSVSSSFTSKPSNAYLLNLLRCVCEALIVINGSTNFALYCCCSRQFMTAVYTLLTTHRRSAVLSKLTINIKDHK